MTWQDLLEHCLAKPGAWQDEPWEGDVVVKVGPKIFAFLGAGAAGMIGLKCGPTREVADEWLLRYPQDASVMAYIGRSAGTACGSAARSLTRSCSKPSTPPT